MILKKLIFNSFYFGKWVVVLKELIFYKFLLRESCAAPERTDF